MAVNRGKTEGKTSAGTRAHASQTFAERRHGQQDVDTSDISQRERDDDSFDYDAAKRQADSSDNPDGHKYQVAVERARQIAGDDVSDSEMRDLIDDEFAKLDPSATGEQMRGEDNAGALVIGGVNDAIDGLTGMIGDGVDWLWDTAAGGIAGAVGDGLGAIAGQEGWGDAAREYVDNVVGDNGIIDPNSIANMAMDIGLSAIPGVGVPLVVGKNLVQNADNIREAASGRDSLTGEELDFDARLANGLAALANVGLSAMPGMGQARNMTKAAQVTSGSVDDVAKSVAQLVDSPATATVREAMFPSNVVRQVSDAAGDLAGRTSKAKGPGEFLGALLGRSTRADDAGEIANLLAHSARQQAAQETAEAATKGVLGKAADAVGNAAGKAASSAGRIADRTPVGNLARRAGRTLGNRVHSAPVAALSAAGTIPMGIVNYAAASDQSLGDTWDDYLSTIRNDDGTPRFWESGLAGTILPVGINLITRGRARGLPGASGAAGANAPALRYAQLLQGGRQGADLARDRSDGSAMSDEEIEDYLATIGGGSDAGTV